MLDFLKEQQIADTCYVRQAEYLTVGEEWNHNVWDPRDNPTGYHALYYRTDHGDGKAVLHLPEKDVEILPDRIYFVPAYSVLGSEISGQMQKYFIHFQSNLIDFGTCLRLNGGCCLPADELTEKLFRTVVENHGKQSVSAQRRVSGAMDILLADLIGKLAVQSRDIEKFGTVLRYIEDRFRENIRVSDLAKLMNLSTVYFANSFKTAFHISPKQYVLGKRLTESQRLLAETDLSVRQIAEAVGFDNENYFSEFFSAKVGISALKFRAHARKR